MQRPTSVLVFGILNLVFGGLGLCGSVWSLVMFVGPGADQLAKGNPVLQQMQADPVMSVYSLAAGGLGLVFTFVLLAAGVGLLLMRPWGRTASIVYAIYGILSSTIGTIVTYVFVLVPMMQRAPQMGELERAGLMGGFIGGIVGGCFGLVYPILLLVFMYRAKVRAAFAAVAEAKMRTPPDSPFETGNPYQSR